ncbi:MAG TPA: sn-glycerol-3-phosphate ABC transporter ATP-binding protein UgpC [Gaiellaceae bacterium]|nr:sn-glycerol-3-phosphate ABC transporter ATP-binding protein UgpC [Gaiellaceae bacterium]
MAAVSFDDVTKQFGSSTVAVDRLTLDVNEGEFLILVGPSGCGKTTALRMVAGLEQVTSGEIAIDGRVVNDVVPTERDIAMVFQNYALYPHMSVFDNIAFPLRQQKVKKAATRERVAEAARLLNIEELLERKPRELSGGQRQRVAIGRALVRRPRAFLMDEPLSNLDAKLRVQMRAELLSLHQRLGITTIYVTHDQTEAMTLGDRVVVMRHGVVQQVDAPERLYRKPANMFVAGFIGSPAMNFVRGTLANGRVVVGEHSVALPSANGHSGPVVVGVRPEDVLIGDAADALPAQIEITEQLGPEVLVHVDVPGLTLAAAEGDEAPPGGRLVARAPGTFKGARGDRVRVAFDTEHLQLFDPASGEALR